MVLQLIAQEVLPYQLEAQVQPSFLCYNSCLHVSLCLIECHSHINFQVTSIQKFEGSKIIHEVIVLTKFSTLKLDIRVLCKIAQEMW